MERKMCDDQGKLAAEIRGDAWGSILSFGTLMPFFGPPFQSTTWGGCPVQKWSKCQPSAESRMTQDIEDARAKLQAMTDQWQSRITDVVEKMSEDLKKLVEDLPAIIQAKMDWGLEPLKENLVILGVNLFFVAVVLFFVVTHYN